MQSGWKKERVEILQQPSQRLKLRGGWEGFKATENGSFEILLSEKVLNQRVYLEDILIVVETYFLPWVYYQVRGEIATDQCCQQT